MSKSIVMEITSLDQLDLENGVYSYTDYLVWKFKERVELFKGKILKMSPAPAFIHQKILRKINRSFDHFSDCSSCEVVFAPFDVRFPDENGNIKTVLQPDLCVICDPSKIDDRGGLGAPDLIVEILSPGNSKKELGNKYKIYEEYGVREYWVVNPSERNILIFVAENGVFRGIAPVVEGDIAKSVIFPELTIDTNGLYDGLTK